MSKPKLDLSAKWAWRKIAYYAAAVLVAVLGAFGVLSEVQVDQWTGQLDKIVPYALGVIAPLLAGAKTHAGSDSTATAADVAAAAAIQGPPGPKGDMGLPTDLDAIGRAVAQHLNDAAADTGNHAEQTPRPATSVADYYGG